MVKLQPVGNKQRERERSPRKNCKDITVSVHTIIIILMAAIQCVHKIPYVVASRPIICSIHQVSCMHWAIS